MSNPVVNIWIGVVSYVGSRFPNSVGDTGLARRLQREFAALDTSVSVRINTANEGRLYGLAPTRRTVKSSIRAQLGLRRRWHRYLNGTPGATSIITDVMASAKAAFQLAHPPPTRTVERLLDIEASHRKLLSEACHSECDWVLILEDDAEAEDVAELALGLVSLMTEAPASVQYVDLSSSFDWKQLGIEHLIREQTALRWGGANSRQILTSQRPVTNTVCAVLYRRSFATVLTEHLDSLPIEPVVPIDWKMNAAIMDMWVQGQLQADASLMLQPAPIVQLSMR